MWPFNKLCKENTEETHHLGEYKPTGEYSVKFQALVYDNDRLIRVAGRNYPLTEDVDGVRIKTAIVVYEKTLAVCQNDGCMEKKTKDVRRRVLPAENISELGLSIDDVKEKPIRLKDND